MPIYEYQCQSCHNLFEYIQKTNDPLLTECKICQGKLEKLVSSTSFQLKGTGWYATDFKDAPKKPAENTSPSETKLTEDKKPTQETSGPSSEKESVKKPTTESISTTKE